MKQNIEIEYKSLLSPFDFNRLKSSFFKDAELLVQKNYYFDTVDKQFYQRHMTLRIRQVNQRSLFTLKQVNDKKQVVEYEIEEDELTIHDPRITELLYQMMLPTDLVCISSALTHRYLISDKKGEWCLDLNEFKRLTDFELEYELTTSDANGLNRFLDFLESYSIVYHKAEPKFLRSLL